MLLNQNPVYDICPQGFTYYINQLLLASLTVAGTRTSSPSKSFESWIWHPRRELKHFNIPILKYEEYVVSNCKLLFTRKIKICDLVNCFHLFYLLESEVMLNICQLLHNCAEGVSRLISRTTIHKPWIKLELTSGKQWVRMSQLCTVIGRNEVEDKQNWVLIWYLST